VVKGRRRLRRSHYPPPRQQPHVSVCRAPPVPRLGHSVSGTRRNGRQQARPARVTRSGGQKGDGGVAGVDQTPVGVDDDRQPLRPGQAPPQVIGQALRQRSDPSVATGRPMPIPMSRAEGPDRPRCGGVHDDRTDAIAGAAPAPSAPPTTAVTAPRTARRSWPTGPAEPPDARHGPTAIPGTPPWSRSAAGPRSPQPLLDTDARPRRATGILNPAPPSAIAPRSPTPPRPAPARTSRACSANTNSHVCATDNPHSGISNATDAVDEVRGSVRCSVSGWHRHRHHAGPSPSATTRHEGWGLLPGHQWGPRPGHQWGLSHGHGQPTAGRAVMSHDATWPGASACRCGTTLSVPASLSAWGRGDQTTSGSSGLG
jgi:hypothetical protein